SGRCRRVPDPDPLPVMSRTGAARKDPFTVSLSFVKTSGTGATQAMLHQGPGGYKAAHLLRRVELRLSWTTQRTEVLPQAARLPIPHLGARAYGRWRSAASASSMAISVRALSTPFAKRWLHRDRSRVQPSSAFFP